MLRSTHRRVWDRTVVVRPPASWMRFADPPFPLTAWAVDAAALADLAHRCSPLQSVGEILNSATRDALSGNFLFTDPDAMTRVTAGRSMFTMNLGLQLRVPSICPFCHERGPIGLESTLKGDTITLRWCCRRCMTDWTVAPDATERR
jgi:hypothetical protein